jgi:hypothetical protein
MEVTREFRYTVLSKVNPFVSDLTTIEISATKDPELRTKLVDLISEFEVLPLTNEAKELAKTYLRYKHIPEPDTLHIAIASIEGMDLLVT